MRSCKRLTVYLHHHFKNIYPFKSKQKPVFCNFFSGQDINFKWSEYNSENTQMPSPKFKISFGHEIQLSWHLSMFFPSVWLNIVSIFFSKIVILNTSVFCGGFMCSGVYLSLNLVNCNSVVKECVHSLVY